MKTSSLPNLLIVGAAKSGTTSLHYYLNQHPRRNSTTYVGCLNIATTSSTPISKNLGQYVIQILIFYFLHTIINQYRGRRTYFFDVRSTKAGDYYMTLTREESVMEMVMIPLEPCNPRNFARCT